MWLEFHIFGKQASTSPISFLESFQYDRVCSGGLMFHAPMKRVPSAANTFHRSSSAVGMLLATWPPPRPPNAGKLIRGLNPISSSSVSGVSSSPSNALPLFFSELPLLFWLVRAGKTNANQRVWCWLRMVVQFDLMQKRPAPRVTCPSGFFYSGLERYGAPSLGYPYGCDSFRKSEYLWEQEKGTCRPHFGPFG